MLKYIITALNNIIHLSLIESYILALLYKGRNEEIHEIFTILYVKIQKFSGAPPQTPSAC